MTDFSRAVADNVAQAYKAMVIADGANLLYRLDDTGTTAADSVGSNTGTISATGVTLSVTGALLTDTDTAMTFDGASGKITSASAVAIGNNCSVEAWVKVANGYNPTQAAWISNRNGSGQLYFGIGNGGPHLFAYYTGGTPAAVNGVKTLNDGNWHHVVWTSDGTTTRLYLDGQQDVATTQTISSAPSGTLNLAYDSGIGNWFAGSIDEVANYPSVLSAATILRHYNAGISFDQVSRLGVFSRTATDTLTAVTEVVTSSLGSVKAVTDTLTAAIDSLQRNAGRLLKDGTSYSATVLALSPLGYWRLDETSGTTAADSSGNNHPETISGSPTLGVTGLIKNDPSTAYLFDGSTSQLVSTAFPTPALPFSVECWMKMPAGNASGALFYTAQQNASSGNSYSVGIGSGTYNSGNAGTHLILLNETIRWVDTGYVVTAGTHHIVLLLDINGHPNVYVDGVSRYSDTTNIGSTTPVNGFMIGTGGSGRYWANVIDEVAFYNFTLTSAQINANYTAGTGGASTAIDAVARTTVISKIITDTLTAATEVIALSFGRVKAITDTLTAAVDAVVRSYGRQVTATDVLTAATDVAVRGYAGVKTFTASITPTSLLGRLTSRILAATLAPTAILLASTPFWTYVSALLTSKARPFVPVALKRKLSTVSYNRPFALKLVKNEAVSTLDTVPDTLELAIGEQVPINIDCSNVLLSGEVIATSPVPVAVVTAAGSGAVIAGATSGAVSINGNLLQLVLVGSVLRQSESYYLVVTFNTAANKTLTIRTKLNVIF